MSSEVRIVPSYLSDENLCTKEENLSAEIFFFDSCAKLFPIKEDSFFMEIIWQCALQMKYNYLS